MMMSIPLPACIACNQGQQRCYIGPDGDVCCNFYLNNVCVAECPAPLVPDGNFDCGGHIIFKFLYTSTLIHLATPPPLFPTLTHTGCGPLTTANGDVSYSDGFLIGSVATHSCNPNHQLLPMGGAMRNCSVSGWSGQDVTCSE